MDKVASIGNLDQEIAKIHDEDIKGFTERVVQRVMKALGGKKSVYVQEEARRLVQYTRVVAYHACQFCSAFRVVGAERDEIIALCLLDTLLEGASIDKKRFSVQFSAGNIEAQRSINKIIARLKSEVNHGSAVIEELDKAEMILLLAPRLLAPRHLFTVQNLESRTAQQFYAAA